MPEMFGMPSGIIAAEQQADTHELQQQKIQEGRRQQAAAAKLAELMQQDPAKQDSAPSEQVFHFATLAAKAGDMTQASELYGKSAGLKHYEAYDQHTKAADDLNEMRIVSGILSEAKDQKSWEAAVHGSELAVGHKSSLAGMQYSPENVQMLKGIVARDKALAQAELNRAKADVIAPEAESKQALRTAQGEAAKARAQRLGKVGADKVPTATLKSVTDLLEASYQNIPPETNRNLSRQIAERAQELLTGSNRGIRPSEAAAQAVGEAQQQHLLDDFKLKKRRTAGMIPGKDADVGVVRWEDLP